MRGNTTHCKSSTKRSRATIRFHCNDPVFAWYIYMFIYNSEIRLRGTIHHCFLINRNLLPSFQKWETVTLGISWLEALVSGLVYYCGCASSAEEFLLFAVFCDFYPYSTVLRSCIYLAVFMYRRPAQTFLPRRLILEILWSNFPGCEDVMFNSLSVNNRGMITPHLGRHRYFRNQGQQQGGTPKSERFLLKNSCNYNHCDSLQSDCSSEEESSFEYGKVEPLSSISQS